MFIIRFLHYLLGYVVFSAYGGFPERFINLCTVMKIPVWEIKSREGVLYGKSPIHAYRTLKQAARKSGMEVRIERRVGLRFFLHRYRRRAGLLVAASVFAAVAALMSCLVWTVNISGNYDVTSEEIHEVFDSLGVRAGVRTSEIDVPAVESAALELLSEKVQWLAVNVSGSAVSIEIREKIKSRPAQDTSTPHHLVSTRDAMLTVLDARDGKEVVRVGSAVAKGDMLVSGITENSDGTVTFHHARGYAQGIVKEAIKTTASRELKAVRVSACRNRISINFMGIKIPPHIASDTYDGSYYYSDRWLYAGNKRLPVGYTLFNWLQFEDFTFECSDAQLKLLTAREYLLQISESFRYGKIVTQTTVQKLTKSGCTAEGNFEVIENIGEELRFYVIEQPDGETHYTFSPPQ